MKAAVLFLLLAIAAEPALAQALPPVAGDAFGAALTGDANPVGGDAFGAQAAGVGGGAPAAGFWWHIFSLILAQLARFDGGFQTVIGALSAWVTPVLRAAAVAYLASLGLILAFAPDGSPLHTLFRPLIRIAIVLFVVSSVPIFMQWAGGVLLGLPRELGAVIAGAFGAGQVDGALFDKVWGDAWTAGALVFDAAPANILKSLIIGIGVLAFQIIASIAIGVGAFVPYVVATFFLKLCVAFGPIFAACWAFPQTKRIADQWLGAALGFIITLAMLTALLALMSQVMAVIMTQLMKPVGGQGNVMDMFQGLFYGAIALLVFGRMCWEVPHLAASISGGVASHASGYFGTAIGAVAGAYAGSRSAIRGTKNVGQKLSGTGPVRMRIAGRSLS